MMCNRMVAVGSYGWINIDHVVAIYRKEGGGAIVILVGGQELALLPDETVALEMELGRRQATRFPAGIETR